MGNLWDCWNTILWAFPVANQQSQSTEEMQPTAVYKLTDS